MEVKFEKATSQDQIKDIYDYNIDVFSDSPDFNWGPQEIKNEVADGWELYAVKYGEEIIAAVFIKMEGKSLLSKNTAIKMLYQGSGFSHKIKDFVDQKALEYKVDDIFHYCRIDNFRMYSLNESHGYKKTFRKVDEHGHVVEWKKMTS